MLKITIIALGNLKEKYLREASAEYEKRLKSFCKLEITQLDPVRLPDNPNPTEIASALNSEADKLLTLIPNNAFVVPLCIEGKLLSSEELSRKIETVTVSGASHLVFIIGSSYGLSDKVKQRADLKMSMSPMTFPHQLARIMLLEQIYRSFKITQGGTYHK